MLRERRKNIQYLTPAELETLPDILRDEKSLLSCRNRAVGLLLLFTGLRGCDIAFLMLDSIGWLSESISVCQQKTGMLVELSLIPLVGKAIYEYLSGERTDTQDRHFSLRRAGHATVFPMVLSGIS